MPIVVDTLIIGASNPNIIRTIEEINSQTGGTINVIGFLDNFLEAGSEILGIQVEGGFEEVSKFQTNVKFVNTIASSCQLRKQTTEYFLERGYESINIIHPSINMNHVKIGNGNLVFEGALLQPCVELGSYNIVSSMACVAHNTKMQNYNFIGPNCYICGRVSMGSENFLGVSSSISPRQHIGDRCVVYGGSFVNRDLETGSKVRGTPAKRF